MMLLAIADHKGTAQRKKHKLQRPTYQNKVVFIVVYMFVFIRMFVFSRRAADQFSLSRDPEILTVFTCHTL